MAFDFAKSKEEDKKEEGFSGDLTKNLHRILKEPRITEKAAYMSGNNVYAFDVPKDANKILIKEAFELVYKIKPKKVNIVNYPKKITGRGRIKGYSGGGKKAYVFLNPGDKIEII